MTPLGVGLVGCGAAAQSIHLAALASLPDLYRVEHCMDADLDVASTVASRVGARWSTHIDPLLDDPAVDVVVIASPGAAHAAQVIAACDARKRAVLCEKPLAESVVDAERIAAASAQTGVPVLVGTMHRHDPVLQAVAREWGDLPARATLVRSDAFIGPNDRLVAAVTEPAMAEPAARADAGPSTPVELLMFAGLMWGLAVHHLPLLRLAVPVLDDLSIEVARPTGPSGYLVSMRTGDRVVQLASSLFRFPRNEWTFELIGPDAAARVEFAPGYIPTRSATASLSTSNGLVVQRTYASSNETGYRAQYRHLAAVASGAAEPLTPGADAVQDARLVERLVAASVAQWEAER